MKTFLLVLLLTLSACGHEPTTPQETVPSQSQSDSNSENETTDCGWDGCYQAPPAPLPSPSPSMVCTPMGCFEQWR